MPGSAVRWAVGGDDADVLAALGVAGIRHTCPTCGATDHGRPTADDGRALSRARCDGVVLAATGDGPLGVDVERIGTPAPAGVVAHPSETGDPLRLWVRKEALLKATGLGLLVAPESFWIGEDGRPSPIPSYDGPPLVVTDLPLPGLVAALATTA